MNSVVIAVLIGAVGLAVWAIYRTWRQGRDMRRGKETDPKHKWGV
jgi:hypothetical protein